MNTNPDVCLHRAANVKAQRTIVWVLAQPIRMMDFGWVGWVVGARGALHGKGKWHDRRLATIGFASASWRERRKQKSHAFPSLKHLVLPYLTCGE